MEPLHIDILNNIITYVDEYNILLLLTSKRWNKIVIPGLQVTNLKSYINKIVPALCYNGDDRLLEWFKTNLKLDFGRNYYHGQMACIEGATKGGHINVIKWLLHEQGNCGNLESVCYTACFYGHLAILK